jgi:phosphoribosylaminoimidazole-succinocarboxamide synthase
MGSVKDLKVISKPTEKSMGIGEFHFSDRYSVFDWGEMPDHIEGKGAALCLVGAYCFERLEERGIRTHYKGLVSEKGKVVSFEELKRPTSIMEVNLVNVFRPRIQPALQGRLVYDYGIFVSNLSNFLIPLEIIYRNGLPEGSSIFKRLERGTVTAKQLDLDHYPRLGERLTKPIFDVSTKLEDKDRYITWEEAQEMAGLANNELQEIKNLLLKVNETITKLAKKAGLENEDGKIELAFNPERRLMVVDAVGTLDECRFTYDGLHVSKEIARQFYRESKWYDDVEEAKKTAETKGIADWKSLCKSQPPKLDKKLMKIISEMYLAAANEITEHRLFEAPSLAKVAEEYRIYTGEEK